MVNECDRAPIEIPRYFLLLWGADNFYAIGEVGEVLYAHD